MVKDLFIHNECKIYHNTGSCFQGVKIYKETVRCKWVFIVTEILNTVVNAFDAHKSTREGLL